MQKSFGKVRSSIWSTGCRWRRFKYISKAHGNYGGDTSAGSTLLPTNHKKKSVCDPEHSDDHQVDNNANTPLLPSSCRRWLSHGHSDNKEGANITNNAKSSDAGEAIGSHHHPADGWSKAADCRVHRHVQAKHRAGVLLKEVK